jgi:hypothetical protein
MPSRKTPYKKSGSKNLIKAKDCYAIKENPTQKTGSKHLSRLHTVRNLWKKSETVWMGSAGRSRSEQEVNGCQY